MFVRFRKAGKGEWRLRVSIAETARRDGKVRSRVVAYLGAIDIRDLGPQPDDARERISILARIQFWERINPKLKTLANRIGGDDGVKRLRMAIHARIPWPMQTERDRLPMLNALCEARDWHSTYEFTKGSIERLDKHHNEAVERYRKDRDELVQDGRKHIQQANIWKEEAERLRRQQHRQVRETA